MAGNNGRRMVIQRRDEHLLRELASMRVIDREQAKVVAGFTSTTRANARLLALYRLGLLRRFFQGTTAGGKKALYSLSPKGARLVDAPHAGLRYGDDELLATNFFVAHQLRVNSVYCAVRYAPIPFPDAVFGRWIGFSQPVAPRLLPDGYFEVTTPQGVTGSFLEVDLGHEGSAVWKVKVDSFLKYAASGDFAKQFGQPRFRVLVVANTEKRVRVLRTLVGRFTEKVFWFASFEAVDQKWCGPDSMLNMYGRCWRWWRQQGDRAAKFAGDGSRTRSTDLDGQRSDGYALWIRSAGGTCASGHWRGPAKRPSVCVPFAARRSVEDSSVGPGRLRTVVQATGTRGFQTAASRAGHAIGGVACQRAGHDSGWDRCFEAEARATL
jgi:Replication-relaxation